MSREMRKMETKINFRKIAIAGLALCIGLGLTATLSVADDKDDEKKPKHTIKEVMKEQKKGGLLPKVLSGEASDEEKKQLLDMYISMLEAKPPKGEMESWQKLAGASALAAAKVVVGREGALDELKKSGGACAACHKAHKP